MCELLFSSACSRQHSNGFHNIPAHHGAYAASHGGHDWRHGGRPDGPARTIGAHDRALGQSWSLSSWAGSSICADGTGRRDLQTPEEAYVEL